LISELGLDLPTLRGANKNIGVFIRVKSGSALSRLGARKGIRLIGISIIAIHLDVVLTTGNHPTLPYCSKEGAVLFGLCFHDVKR